LVIAGKTNLNKECTMHTNKPKLTLTQPVDYQIKISGALPSFWADGDSSASITVEVSAGGQVISTITGQMDQAALIGLLRRLYSLGFPLISVNCIQPE
jgi:hypothetical protein